MRKIMIVLIVGAFLFSCEKSNDLPVYDNMEVTSEFRLYDAIILSEGDCAGDSQTHTYICFDSVLNDSRCPKEVQCFWEGNAQVRFKFVNSADKPAFFNLNTHLGFTTDTIIGGYKFILKALYPYPSIKNIILHKAYSAEIEIEKETV